eukprot:scaffold2806_cov135-Isochrysis_galbana.AAC.4
MSTMCCARTCHFVFEIVFVLSSQVTRSAGLCRRKTAAAIFALPPASLRGSSSLLPHAWRWSTGPKCPVEASSPQPRPSVPWHPRPPDPRPLLQDAAFAPQRNAPDAQLGHRNRDRAGAEPKVVECHRKLSSATLGHAQQGVAEVRVHPWGIPYWATACMGACPQVSSTPGIWAGIRAKSSACVVRPTAAEHGVMRHRRTGELQTRVGLGTTLFRLARSFLSLAFSCRTRKSSTPRALAGDTASYFKDGANVCFGGGGGRSTRM